MRDTEKRPERRYPKPSVWRTCRALANRRRLEIVCHLLRFPDQCVTDIGRAVRVPPPVASEHLRGLEARGILAVRRQGRHVLYRLNQGDRPTVAAPAVDAVARILARDPARVPEVFRLCTAFTHPRRALIFQTLWTRPRGRAELEAVCQISTPAIQRHLAKLRGRGFVRRSGLTYHACIPAHPLARALAHMCVQDPDEGDLRGKEK